MCLLLLLSVFLSAGSSILLAQAPEADRFEDNDLLSEATFIAAGSEIGSLTMVPADDPDWFRVLLGPDGSINGQFRIEVVATPGLDLTLTIYDDSTNPVAVVDDSDGPNASVKLTVEDEAYYAIEVTNATEVEGFYVLRIRDLTSEPSPTPTEDDDDEVSSTPASATTASPTTLPPPSGDFAEPNFNFATAYRVVPGDVLAGLTFEPTQPGTVDNDYFVLGVRSGITYTCRTEDLGSGIDTNLIAYSSPNERDLIGGNDDIDTQAGQINSSLTFTANKEGDIYLLIGYKYAGRGRAPDPDATYSLTCIAGETTTEEAAMSAGNSGGGMTAAKSPISIELLDGPQREPTPTSLPVVPQTIDILVGYDRNDNGEVDPNEGVEGLSVRVVDVTSNRELSHGFTDSSGTLRFTLAAGSSFRVVIPFLGASEDFRPGSPVQWTLLIPASSVPGLIP